MGGQSQRITRSWAPEAQKAEAQSIGRSFPPCLTAPLPLVSSDFLINTAAIRIRCNLQKTNDGDR